MKRFLTFLFLIFFALIFHEKVMEGTALGLLLWYRFLIPALLPFILITNALTETHSYDAITNIFSKRFPYICQYIAIILGNLCGYPIGAKILNDFVNSGNISSKDANEILSLASQASPMFLLGFVYPLLPNNSLCILLFLCAIYLPSVLLYFIRTRHSSYKMIHDTHKRNGNDIDYNITVTFMQTIKILVIIGVYVIIFSILINVTSSFLHNDAAKCFLSFIEITNGLKLIQSLNLPYRISICLIMSLSSFGGLCTAFQIKSVLSYQGASIKKYLQDKTILSAGTFLLTYIFLN